MEALKKIFWAIVIIVIALIPTWIFLAIRYLIGSQGFWENFVLLVAGLFFLGTVQLVLVVFAAGLIFGVLLD